MGWPSGLGLGRNCERAGILSRVLKEGNKRGLTFLGLSSLFLLATYTGIYGNLLGIEDLLFFGGAGVGGNGEKISKIIEYNE